MRETLTFLTKMLAEPFAVEFCAFAEREARSVAEGGLFGSIGENVSQALRRGAGYNPDPVVLIDLFVLELLDVARYAGEDVVIGKTKMPA